MKTESKSQPAAGWQGSTLGRGLSVGLLGSAAFGVSAAVGHGPAAMAQGAWMGPALFVGGAALATPPLYMFSALAGGRVSVKEALSRTSGALGAVATALVGLAAPAAYLSTTLRTDLAPTLLVLCCVIAGGSGVVAITRASLRTEARPEARFAALLWAAFALALGARLMIAIARNSHLPGGV